LLLGTRALAVERDGWELLHQPVKAFALADLDGRALRSADLRGRVVVVDFWTTWCGPCVKELPDLAAYHQRLAGRKDVALLSFNATEEKDVVTEFVKLRKVAFPVYLADSLVEPYGVVGFPTKLVIDLRPGAGGTSGVGLLRFRKEGAVPVAGIEARVAELLAERP
jgi:thiol-disulfide isomerase/thioredoxin